MKFASGRMITVVGVTLALVGLLAFSLAMPSTTTGQETDVTPPAEDDAGQPPASDPDGDGAVGDGTSGPDADETAQPPASLPDAGDGPAGQATSWAKLVLMALLVGVGITLTGAGRLIARATRRVDGD